MFSVWDRIEENDFAHTVTKALEALFPEDPPRFMARTPPWLPRPGDHRARSEARRIPRVTPYRHGCGTQSGDIAADPGDRVLPRDTAAQRDRGARPVAAR